MHSIWKVKNESNLYVSKWGKSPTLIKVGQAKQGRRHWLRVSLQYSYGINPHQPQTNKTKLEETLHVCGTFPAPLYIMQLLKLTYVLAQWKSSHASLLLFSLILHSFVGIQKAHVWPDLYENDRHKFNSFHQTIYYIWCNDEVSFLACNARNLLHRVMGL